MPSSSAYVPHHHRHHSIWVREKGLTPTYILTFADCAHSPRPCQLHQRQHQTERWPLKPLQDLLAVWMWVSAFYFVGSSVPSAFVLTMICFKPLQSPSLSPSIRFSARSSLTLSPTSPGPFLRTMSTSRGTHRRRSIARGRRLRSWHWTTTRRIQSTRTKATAVPSAFKLFE